MPKSHWQTCAFTAKINLVSGRPLTATGRSNKDEETMMSWKSPKIVEIALGAEINSYACAEAKK